MTCVASDSVFVADHAAHHTDVEALDWPDHVTSPAACAAHHTISFTPAWEQILAARESSQWGPLWCNSLKVLQCIKNNCNR